MVREVNKKITCFFKRKIGNIICLILCFNLIISLFVPITLVAANGLTNGVTIADPDTTDSYQNFLINEKNGSRYAGRVWSDKSVFTGNISLDYATDGYDGTITNNGDFLHAFSVLGSSQRINGYSVSPIDAVFLLDMSGSMAYDLHSSEAGHTHTTDETGAKEHLAHSRIRKVLDSMNSAIDTLMDLNETNRVAVIAYGATAEVLMPLAHYKKDEGSDVYLTISDLTNYTSHTPTETGSGAYTVTAKAQKAKTDKVNSIKNNIEYESYTKGVRNNFPHNKSKSYYNSNEGTLSNTPENTVYVGYMTNMQAGIYKGFNELYTHMQNKEDVIYTYTSDNNEVTVPRIPVAFVMTDGGSNYALKEDNYSTNTGDEWHNVPDITLDNSDDIRDNYLKYHSECNYDFVGGDAVILDILLTASYMKAKVQKKYTELLNQTNALTGNESLDFKVHTISVDTPVTDWQVPRVYATLNPRQYFNATGDPSFNKPENGSDQMYNKNITDAYKYFLEWQEKDIEIKFCDNDGISDGRCKNSTSNRTIKFNRLKDEENAEVTNQDVIDNIYYNDDFYDISATNLEDAFDILITNINGEAFIPVGGANEFGSNDSLTYMDPIGEYMEIKEDSIKLKDNKTYDMALLLFGNMYGIEKEAVYDPLFNQKYLVDDKFESGWYSSDGTKTDDGNWSNGDTYYLDEEEAKRYITDENARNDSKKKYIIYRLALDDVERGKVQKNESYGDIDLVYYKLDDIKVLIEIDESGNEKLYFNLPTTALPLQTVTIRMDKDNKNVESYKTNLADKKLSTPLRLFYEVGVAENIKKNDGKDIDLDKIDEEYLKKNTTEDGFLKFYSNYYSATTYDGYTADTQADARTKGDALLTLSPNTNNRYYIFQKNLKIYGHAYIIGSNGQVKEESDPLNFEGADFDGEYAGKTVNNKPDSTAQAAIKEAYEKGELKKGDIIVLKDDVVKYGTNPSSDDFYYFAIDYYMPTKDGKGKQVQYVVARKGSEFGSGIVEHEGTKLPKGDFLCWIDASGQNKETYNFEDKISDEKKSSGTWVLATKIGGLRIGDLHQSISLKSENKTGTSKSYYLPVIADDLSTEGSDAILDTYLGNNGVIKYKSPGTATGDEYHEIEIPNTGGNNFIIYMIICSIISLISLSVYKRKILKGQKYKIQN